MDPASIQQARRQIRQRLDELELERVRRDADQIRARCQSFAGFFREAWHVLEPSTPLRWNWHLQAMCDHLQAITEGRLHPRIIINVPPGCSKSTIVSVMWQAWEWGPMGLRGNKFLSTSYEMDVVERDTDKTRKLLLSDWYQALWPLVLTRSRGDYFENANMGFRQGAAFRSLTGKRGDRLTIDDPHSIDGAESETEREKAVRRFIEGGQNRLNDMERSAIVIVMQRLHEADLTGALLAREMGYLHLMLPMEFEPERKCVTHDKLGRVFFEDPRSYDGELLDPVRFPPHVVRAYANDNDYAHASQNQQRPVPREGGMFKPAMLLHVDTVPPNAIYVRGWDIAGSTRKKSPFTVGALLAYAAPLVYIVNIERARKEIHEAESLMVERARMDAVEFGAQTLQSFPQDPGSAGKSQKTHMSNRLGGLNFKFSTESGAKQDRAIPFASMVNAGNVRIVGSAPPWLKPLIDEMSMFPSSAYKDQVDALSRAFMELAKFMADDSDDMVYAPIYGHKIQAVI
jgi:predicted phage terminase large subunit-like protein